MGSHSKLNLKTVELFHKRENKFTFKFLQNPTQKVVNELYSFHCCQWRHLAGWKNNKWHPNKIVTQTYSKAIFDLMQEFLGMDEESFASKECPFLKDTWHIFVGGNFASTHPDMIHLSFWNDLFLQGSYLSGFTLQGVILALLEVPSVKRNSCPKSILVYNSISTFRVLFSQGSYSNYANNLSGSYFAKSY